MSTTTESTTTADRGRHLRGVLDTVRAAWRRWCERLPKAGGFVALAVACLACRNSVTTAPAAAAPCPGSISLSWVITVGAARPQTCAQVGATSVALRIQSRTGGGSIFTAFPCEGSPGTVNVPPGLYDVAIELHNADSVKLSTAPTQTSVAVAVGRTTPLAPVSFHVGAGGGNATVLLGIQSLGAGFNCQSPDVFGAGITSTSLTVTSAGGNCAPVTFDRLRADEVVGTYKVNCSSPLSVPCIEIDEGLKTSELAPGRYDVHVVGKTGLVNCWTADASIEVPATGQLQHVIFLQHQSLPGC